jgi:hypothetical protein
MLSYAGSILRCAESLDQAPKETSAERRTAEPVRQVWISE